MFTIKLIMLFVAKAITYGLCLAFGFWLMGKITQYIDYYVWLLINDREQFWLEISLIGKSEAVVMPEVKPIIQEIAASGS